jgi:hypothetical protein
MDININLRIRFTKNKYIKRKPKNIYYIYNTNYNKFIRHQQLSYIRKNKIKNKKIINKLRDEKHNYKYFY